ncbi:peroxidase family protein [Mycobacterium sp. 236(2023)]|uniref:peroxidase family protein n=1 Tax=Mycobacterium sp. 236(2023) TaxID=3038163 RepID=UPI0024154C1C|nr:peroxidase family protein [Mycobacterium sp. 236(2023)]MDG4668214.1 peroxidase family protein [Mycobacterium sp. 236(2023)]
MSSRFIKFAEFLDRRWGWDNLPPTLGLLTLVGIRNRLREDNLFDTHEGAPPPAPAREPHEYLTVRTVDGSYNDLSAPSMGMAGTRFGRNVAPESAPAEAPPQLLDPNPMTISTQLLHRETFTPATTVNVLAAAWLQFEVHDWFSHGTTTDRMIEVPRPAGYDWPTDPVCVPATPSDPTASGGSRAKTYLNVDSHWWDGSQIYGSTIAAQQAVRSGRNGKLSIDDDGFISTDPAQTDPFLTNDGWWLGLELLTTLFMNEHNAICDKLASAYPRWTDDQLFDKARLITTALITKIHTLEWTPALLGHPALEQGMRGNWFGAAGERVKRLAGRLSSSDFISGIPGSATDHHAAPYSVTEEFVTVYRMHPLLPDDFGFVALDGAPSLSCSFDDIRSTRSRSALEKVGAGNAMYSLGVANAGALALHNSPRFMERFDRTDNLVIDLNAVDVLRSRERGVPRYNDFRQSLRLPRARSFDEISRGNLETAETLRHVYGGDIDKVDTVVGMFGERLPKGFAFGETAFRIFVLMATRRLKSDRFYSIDFTPRIYTPEGMAWIDGNDMMSVLTRHHPELAPALRGQGNVFAPWRALR